MKVYVVTDGDYSDYHIVAVYTDSALAEKYVSIYSGRIEKYDTDPDIPYPPDGHGVWSVVMLKDGATIHCFSYMDTPTYLERCNDAPQLVWNSYISGDISLYPQEQLESRKRGYIYKDAIMYVYVLARDAEHAVKIANEKRAQLIANGEWEKENA